MERLVERLRKQAETISMIKRAAAENKSLRQPGNTERQTDLYMWTAPEQTLEGQAADALTEAREQNEALQDQLAETQMLAFKWMEAHDKLHAGKPYSFPKPADLPEALTEALSLIREARKVLGDVPAPPSWPLWGRMCEALRDFDAFIDKHGGEQ